MTDEPCAELAAQVREALGDVPSVENVSVSMAEPSYTVTVLIRSRDLDVWEAIYERLARRCADANMEVLIDTQGGCEDD